MLDFSNFQTKYPAGNLQVFSVPGGANDWHEWVKPRGCTAAMIIGVGGGGSGGSGRTGTSASNRGGGGGGASSSISRFLIPIIYLPDSLFISVGHFVSASAGTHSIISIAPNNSAGNLIFNSGFGGAGGNSGSGTGGSAGSATAGSTVGANPLMNFGQYSTSPGQGGAAGGTNGAAGASITYGNTGIALSAGAGGAGTDTSNNTFAGGDINGTAPLPSILGGAGGGNPGNGGIFYSNGLMWYGGSGGGSVGAAGTGGKGGDGALGCGGGGGGAGVTGGAGGNGGNGCIWIVCF